jgi:hypothetical protein
MTLSRVGSIQVNVNCSSSCGLAVGIAQLLRLVTSSHLWFKYGSYCRHPPAPYLSLQLQWVSRRRDLLFLAIFLVKPSSADVLLLDS